MGQRWAAVRPSFLLSLLLVLLLLPACAYVGYLAGARIGYHYQESKYARTLTKQGVPELRPLGETAYAFELSHVLLLQKKKASFEQQIAVLQEMRPNAARELWPIIDLRVAEDHVVLARLGEQAHIPDQAAVHRRIAEDLLRSLGWQDVSENMLNGVADRQLQSGVGTKPRK